VLEQGPTVSDHITSLLQVHQDLPPLLQQDHSIMLNLSCGQGLLGVCRRPSLTPSVRTARWRCIAGSDLGEGDLHCPAALVLFEVALQTLTAPRLSVYWHCLFGHRCLQTLLPMGAAREGRHWVA